MPPPLLASLQRRPVLVALFAAFSLILITISHTHESLPDVPFLPKWQKELPIVRAGRTVLYESAVHDEVTGALGHSLSQLNVSLTYASEWTGAGWARIKSRTRVLAQRNVRRAAFVQLCGWRHTGAARGAVACQASTRHGVV
jgi:hypothetical protein